MNLKTCAMCKAGKDPSCFYPHPYGSFGVGSRCRDCQKIYYKLYSDKKRDYQRQRGKAYHRKNRDRILPIMRERQAQRLADPGYRAECNQRAREARRENRDEINARVRTYRAGRKDKLKEERRRYKQKHPDRVKEQARKTVIKNQATTQASKRAREFKKKRAMPVWADREKINDFFRLAKTYDYQVDHIIPIMHPDVCGLHNEFNLQLLPAEQNGFKTNKWDGTYENAGWLEEYITAYGE